MNYYSCDSFMSNSILLIFFLLVKCIEYFIKRGVQMNDLNIKNLIL